jgi:hypothetical protein
LGEGFKSDKTYLLIILQAKWVYQLVINKIKHATKEKKMTQDGRIHVLVDEESSNEGKS